METASKLAEANLRIPRSHLLAAYLSNTVEENERELAIDSDSVHVNLKSVRGPDAPLENRASTWRRPPALTDRGCGACATAGSRGIPITGLDKYLPVRRETSDEPSRPAWLRGRIRLQFCSSWRIARWHRIRFRSIPEHTFHMGLRSLEKHVDPLLSEPILASRSLCYSFTGR
jgi:hypothetical protein